ncbi:MAG: hypothetical protein ACOXZK_01870 [Bacteroidales bacterium]
METEKINEIAFQLAIDFRVFIHKTTEQNVSVPDEYYYSQAGFENWTIIFFQSV